jgi:hypothetical protein
MYPSRFKLSARVSSSNPDAVQPILEQNLPRGSFKQVKGEFVIVAELKGETAKELNRNLLSALRRAEKKTRLRAEWTSCDGTTQRYFDYVLKKTSSSGEPKTTARI